MKITDELLRAVVDFDPEAAPTDDPPTCLDCGGEYLLADFDEPTPLCDACAHAAVRCAASELRDLRALLATPCPWPRAIDRGAGVVFLAGGLDGDMTPDEAIALGAALIRAALEARKDVP